MIDAIAPAVGVSVRPVKTLIERLMPIANIPGKRTAKKSPTQRSLERMRSLGYVCAVVEKWNPHARIRQDLYGFIDVLCVKGDEIVGVQATSGPNVAARVTKITEHENWPLVCKAIRVVVQGWRKSRKTNRWEVREVAL